MREVNENVDKARRTGHIARSMPSKPAAYYNEFDSYAGEWLRNLIAKGLIADGVVDTRSILDVRPDDLKGFTQCHFFAGIGGWSFAARLAGVADSFPVWTGSCPCQPFSAAGKQRGFADERHLWPHFARLISECRPPIVFGEQVASATAWLRLVRSDLEALEYAMGAIPIQAASAGADHLRDRYWFMGHDTRVGRGEGRPEHEFRGGRVAIASTSGAIDVADSNVIGTRPVAENIQTGQSESGGDDFEWVIGADGKARRVKPGIRLLAHGVPDRVAKLRAFGNAIDPRPASEFIRAVLAI